MEEKKIKIKLLWMNAWFGLLAVVGVLIFNPLPLTPILQYFFNYEAYIQRHNQKAVVFETEVTILGRGSRMKIETEDGVFYFYRRTAVSFNKTTAKLETAEYIEIWYNEENRRVSEIRVNQSDFIVSREGSIIIIFLIVPTIIGLLLLTSIMLIIQTKGWGDEDLLEKYPKGLLKTIFGQEKI